ncbi:MAG: metallophosphoesterase [Nitrospinota bacterium]|nr:metallophosphoesterase [Nitrospinota bacterium]
MLVFISDLHLTDGSSGETINAGAFRKFTTVVGEMVEKAKADSLEIVFLGDIFDVIRSSVWSTTTIRPWSGPKGKDGSGRTLEDITNEIVDQIMANQTNIDSMNYLKSFADQMRQTDKQTGSGQKEVKFTYVIGNHDWLINRFEGARVKIAKFLGADPDHFKKNLYPEEKYAPEYKVFGRHGDLYDNFNYDAERDASSLGDAIVIELLNKFPFEVQKVIGNNSDKELIESLKEIDNVRPLLDAPMWLYGACNRAKDSATASKVKSVWNRMVDDFLDNGFVKEHDKKWRFDTVDFLGIALKVSQNISMRDLTKLPLKYLNIGESGYGEKAYEERYLKNRSVDYIVYGHTHNHSVQPLDQVQMENGRSINQIYFNTGTWRKVLRRTSYDKNNFEFIGWKVMTFLTFYLPEERGDYRYEVWSGVLG